MSVLTCNKCGAQWEASHTPTCPECLAKLWNTAPNMIKAKHDPSVLPSASTADRSVLPDDFLKRPYDYFRHAAYSGTALYSMQHKEYCYVVGVDSQLTAGSAIPSGYAMPTRPMDTFLIAKYLGPDAHIYCEDETVIQAKISQGTFQPLGRCVVSGCNNLQIPGESCCAKHKPSPDAS